MHPGHVHGTRRPLRCGSDGWIGLAGWSAGVVRFEVPVYSSAAREFETRPIKFRLASYQERTTMWIKPEFTEMRFGFEITMYIGNR